MKEHIEVKTAKRELWPAKVFILCTVIGFVGLYSLGIKGMENLPRRGKEIVALQHRINVMESRIGDIESGAYYRRIAALVGGDLSSDAVRTYIAVNKVSGSTTEERKELEKAKVHLEKLTGKTIIDRVETVGEITPAMNPFASLAVHLET